MGAWVSGVGTGGYRYGFNGKENDNEGGEGIQDYGMRIYSERLGRFLSVDPLTKKYPELTPYQFTSNRPIDGVDLDGKEFYSVHIKEYPDGSRVKTGVINYTNVFQKGMTNIPTEAGVGPQGDVGVNYTITKVNLDGKELKKVGFNVKNFYGIYNGPNNPKQYWEKPNEKGEYADDYSLSPINEADGNGMIHDQDFDKLHLSGLSGVMNEKSTPANEAYRKRAAVIVEKQKNGEKDNVTGKPVTMKSAQAAHKYAEQGTKSFKAAEEAKKAITKTIDASINN